MKLNFLSIYQTSTLHLKRLLLVIAFLATTSIWAEEFSQQENISSNATTPTSPSFTKEGVILEMSSFLSLKDAATIQSQDADFLKGYFPVTAQFCSAVLNRALSKLAYADEVQGVDGAEKLSVQELLDALSTGATKQFAAEVEFRKSSNTLAHDGPEDFLYSELVEQTPPQQTATQLNHESNNESDHLHDEKTPSVIVRSTDENGFNHYTVVEGQEETLLGYFKCLDATNNKNGLITETKTTPLKTAQVSSIDNSSPESTTSSQTQESLVKNRSWQEWRDHLTDAQRKSILEVAVVAGATVLIITCPEAAAIIRSEWMCLVCIPCIFEFYDKVSTCLGAFWD